MGNIYIQPNTNITKSSKALEKYMMEAYNKYEGKPRTIRRAGADYPNLHVHDGGIALHLDTFYDVHYMPGEYYPTLLVDIDTCKYGEKPYSDILEDVKTAFKFIEGGQVETMDE